MEFASSLSVLMLLKPWNAVRTEALLTTVPQATARLRATWPETGAPFTEPPLRAPVMASGVGQTVLAGRPVPFGSAAVTIGSPFVEGFADEGTGRSWLALLSRVRCVPLLPTYAADSTKW